MRSNKRPPTKKSVKIRESGSKGIAREISRIKVNQKEIFNAFLRISIPMAIITWKESRFVDVNDALIQFTGCQRKEIIGHTAAEIGFITEEQTIPVAHKLKKNGRIDNHEIVIRTKNGKLQVGLLNAVMIRFGLDRYFLAAITDITQRKQVEESLKDSEEKYRQLVENSRDVIFTVDLNCIVNFVSPSINDLMGYPATELIGKPAWFRVHRQDVAKCKAFFRDAIETGQCGSDMEVRVRHKDGSWRWFITNINFIIDRGGNLSGLEGIFKDVTERKRSLELLVESEKRFRLITENIIDIILLVDEHYTCQYVSRIKEKLGYNAEEVIGTSMFKLVHPDDLETVTRLCREGIERLWNEVICEAKFRCKDGRHISMEVKARALTDVQGKFMGTVCIIHELEKHEMSKKEIMYPAKALAGKKHQLSLRENEILEWIIEGKSTWDISAILGITESTVKYHVDNIMKKLGAVNRPHAVAIAMQEELIRRN